LRCEIIASQPIDVWRPKKDSAARKLFALSVLGAVAGFWWPPRYRIAAAQVPQNSKWNDMPDDAFLISPDLQGLN
jgi:hypothetical protein